MNIFIAKNGQPMGPITTAELTEKVRAGELSLDDLAWHEGCPDWAQLRDMPNIVSVIVPPLPSNRPDNGDPSVTSSLLPSTPPPLPPSDSPLSNVDGTHGRPNLSAIGEKPNSRQQSNINSAEPNWLNRERSIRIPLIIAGVLLGGGLLVGLLMGEWGAFVLASLIAFVIAAMGLKREKLSAFGKTRPAFAGALVLSLGILIFLFGILLSIFIIAAIFQTGLNVKLVFASVAMVGMFKYGWSWIALGLKGLKTLKRQ